MVTGSVRRGISLALSAIWLCVGFVSNASSAVSDLQDNALYSVDVSCSTVLAKQSTPKKNSPADIPIIGKLFSKKNSENSVFLVYFVDRASLYASLGKTINDAGVIEALSSIKRVNVISYNTKSTVDGVIKTTSFNSRHVCFDDHFLMSKADNLVAVSSSLDISDPQQAKFYRTLTTAVGFGSGIIPVFLAGAQEQQASAIIKSVNSIFSDIGTALGLLKTNVQNGEPFILNIGTTVIPTPYGRMTIKVHSVTSLYPRYLKALDDSEDEASKSATATTAAPACLQLVKKLNSLGIMSDSDIAISMSKYAVSKGYGKVDFLNCLQNRENAQTLLRLQAKNVEKTFALNQDDLDLFVFPNEIYIDPSNQQFSLTLDTAARDLRKTVNAEIKGLKVGIAQNPTFLPGAAPQYHWNDATDDTKVATFDGFIDLLVAGGFVRFGCYAKFDVPDDTAGWSTPYGILAITPPAGNEPVPASKVLAILVRFRGTHIGNFTVTDSTEIVKAIANKRNNKCGADGKEITIATD